MKTTIGIIGVGSMGGAIYRQLRDTMGPENIFLCNRTRPKQIDRNTYFSFDANDVASRADSIIFAVKPQSLPGLLETLTVDISRKLVISILAGTPLKKLKQKTGAQKIIRAMPNLPAQVGHGITGWVATSAVSKKEKSFVKELFSALGCEIQLPSEAMIDSFSVVSGCGPAYFFALTELLVEAAKRYGFSLRDAQRIASATCIGAAHLLASGGKSAAEWRKAVTSKGGITEAVLKFLKKKNADTIFYQALKTGIKRSKELARSKSL